MAILADLALRLRMNSAELTTGLQKAKSSLNDANKASSEFKKGMKGALNEVETGLDRLIPGFSNFTSGIGKAISSVGGLSKSMNVLKVAMISTGIGALVVALGSLIAYFKNAEAGGDKFAKVLGTIKAVIGEVLQRVNLLGEAVFLLLKGRFKEAGEKAKEAFKDLGKEIKAAAEAGAEAADRRDALEDKEIAFITKRQELENKIAKAREIYSNEQSSALEKEKAIKEAIAAQNELYSTQTALAQENLEIIKLENSTKERTNVQIKEEQEAEAAVLALQAEQSMELRGLYKLQKNINAEVLKEAEARGQALEYLKAQAESVKYTVDVDTNWKPMSVEEWAAQYPDVTKDPNYIKSQEAIAQAAAERKKRQEEEAKKDKDHWKENAASVLEYADAAMGAFDAISMFQEAAMNRELAAAGNNEELKDKIRRKYAKKQQTVSVMQAIVNGAVAVTKALAELGPIAGPIMAGVTAGTVAAQVALIKSQAFADGGIVYGPTLGLVGEYVGARNNPEVIAPLNDLRNILGTTGMTGEVRFVIEQDKLVGILSDYSKKQMYF